MTWHQVSVRLTLGRAKRQAAEAGRLAALSGHILPLGALAIGMLVLFRGALFLGEQFVERDLVGYYIPERSLVRRLTLESGCLPQWNPYFASGQPFAANPEHAMFHPITWLFLVLPFEWAMRLQVMLPVLLAFFTMRFFLRVLPVSKRAAFLGGLGFAFGGYLLSMTNLLPILFAVPALPLVLAFVLRAFRSGSRRDGALLGISFGLLCLAGEPSTLLMTPILVVATLLFETVRTRRRARHPRSRWSRGTVVVLGVVLGVVTGAAALLPAARLMGRTERALGLPDQAANVWSMPVARLLEFVWPYGLGRVERGPGGFAGAGLYPDKGAPLVLSLYQGLLIALAAAASLGCKSLRRRPERLVWVSLAIAGLVVALGVRTPVWSLLRHNVPLLSGLRFPEKFILLSSFSVVVLAALGVDGLLRSVKRLRARFPRWLGWGAFLGIAALLLGAREISLVVLGAAAAAEVHKDLVFDGAVLVATALAYASVLSLRLPSRIREPLLVAVFLGDLLASGVRLTRSEPLPMTPPLPLARELLAGPPNGAAGAPLAGPVFSQAAWIPHDRQVHALLSPPLPALWGIATAFEPDFDLTELRWSRRATRLFLSVLDRDEATAVALMERRGVVAVVKLLPSAASRQARDDGEALLAGVGWLPSPRPFAFAATAVTRVAGEVGWLETVLGLGAAASGTVCLDTTDPFSGEGDCGPRVRPSPGPATVTIVDRRPSRVELHVSSSGADGGPSLVAVNQTWDEFWSATVDGEETRVLRVDVSLSGVVVPNGRHVVVLTYNDLWIRRGIGLSLCGLLLAVALLYGRREGVEAVAFEC